MVCLLAISVHAKIASAQQGPTQKEERAKCNGIGKGLVTTTIEDKATGKPQVQFRCSAGAGDVCLYVDQAGKRKLCDDGDNEELKRWVAKHSSDVANELSETFESKGTGDSRGAFVIDTYGLAVPIDRGAEPTRNPGEERLVNIADNEGLNRALSGLPDRMTDYGLYLLERGRDLDRIRMERLVEASDLGIRPLEHVTFERTGDDGLNLLHVMRVDLTPDPRNTFTENPALRAGDTITEGRASDLRPANEAAKPVEIPNLLDEQLRMKSLETFGEPKREKIAASGAVEPQSRANSSGAGSWVNSQAERALGFLRGLVGWWW